MSTSHLFFLRLRRRRTSNGHGFLSPPRLLWLRLSRSTKAGRRARTNLFPSCWLGSYHSSLNAPSRGAPCPHICLLENMRYFIMQEEHDLVPACLFNVALKFSSRGFYFGCMLSYKHEPHCWVGYLQGSILKSILGKLMQIQ